MALPLPLVRLRLGRLGDGRAVRRAAAVVLGLALPLALAVPLAGCLGDAERGNPLDPLSDNFVDAGTVAGTVTRLAPPFAPLAGAEVRLSPLDGDGAELLARTAASGRFSVRAVPTGRYVARAEADGYTAAAETVDVAAGRLAEVALRLGGRPAVTALHLRTEHLDRWWPGPLARLAVEADVADPDGAADVRRVTVRVPGLAFADTLRPDAATPGRWARTFEPAELPAPLAALLGEPVVVEVEDRGGAHGAPASAQIVRIIEPYPRTTSPQGLAVVGPTPTLVWEPAAFAFAFTYRVTVVLVTPDVEVRVAAFDGLPPSQTSLALTEPLADGDYYWTVAVVDAHGNAARSREAGFRVAP